MSNQQFIWQERYSIGVELIDREHRKLFSIMNKLFSYDENDEKCKWAYQEGIKFFKGHAMKHFAEEEVYMASIGYEGYETHRKLHDTFRKKTLPEIEKELLQTEYSPDAIRHFLGVCAGWLIGHTLTEDRAINGEMTSKWNDLLPDEEQTALKKMVIKLLYELFQLDAKLISESYGGEKFGRGVYYRLVYGSAKKEKWEIFLVLEERLIVSTIGSIVDADAERLNVMMMNAARYTARQFVERIMNHFPGKDKLEIKEENLLTCTQFQNIYDRQSPQCSLLFDTGQGYFAFCITAPHLLKEEEGFVLNAENATKEITKYLATNANEVENSGKKKILIVDDSGVILQAMKELFEKDYDVTPVKSGVAALRSMTLNMPDLVLLDYEMPVCDGKQVLEMIRAEETFADVPVIFLTGTVDKERIQKLIPLKPAGYLLKTSRLQEIKDNVDEFFRR